MKQDKFQHIIAGAIIALAVGFIAYFFSGEDGTRSLAAGIYAALSGGLVGAAVKEYCDYTYAKKWDWWDFFATIIGVVLAVLIILGMHYGKG